MPNLKESIKKLNEASLYRGLKSKWSWKSKMLAELRYNSNKSTDLVAYSFGVQLNHLGSHASK